MLMRQLTQHAYDVHETDQFWTVHNTDWVREHAWNHDDDDDDVRESCVVETPRAPDRPSLSRRRNRDKVVKRQCRSRSLSRRRNRDNDDLEKILKDFSEDVDIAKKRLFAKMRHVREMTFM